MASELGAPSALQLKVDESADAIASQSSPREPVLRTAPTGVSYMCGGIGADEAAQMKKLAAAYHLMLSFTEKDSGYLTDINVSISDKTGKPMLSVFCDAAILLVNFPKNGTYRISAEAGGITLRKTVTVEAKPRKNVSLVLAWPRQFYESTDAVPPSSPTPESPSSK